MTECEWTYDSDYLEGDTYFTGCDQRNIAWDVGTPAEHGYRFCSYCGKVLKLKVPRGTTRPPSQEWPCLDT